MPARDPRAVLPPRARIGLAALVALACAPRGTTNPPPDGPPVARSAAVEATPRAAASTGVLDPALARAETTRILAEVAKSRNLAVKSEVQVDVIGKAGIRAFAKASMYEDTTPAELLMLGRIEASLGVIPPGSDPEQVILDLLEQGVLGLYDPKKKTLFIGDFVETSMLSMVVGHEIAHGLQDMYFDLDKLQEPMRHRSDAESARRFLIEGEAQAAYLAWVSGEQGLAALADPVLDALGDQALELAGLASPYPILARSLQMPYADGTATVARLVQRNGWPAIDALYQKLPDTTEQMLHIDKLIAREPAISAKMDPAALESLASKAGLALVWHDDLGEAALLAMLAEAFDAKPARRAASGWGGDHFVAFDSPNADAAAPPPMVAAITVWDTEADAVEFETAFRRYLAEHAAAGHVIDRKDRRVVFATGVPQQIGADALRSAMWRGAKVGK